MIEKIIFDYGGVFTNGSRAAFVARELSATEEQRQEVLKFLGSDFIKEAAEGKHSGVELLERLQALLGGMDSARIRATFARACEPDPQLLQLVQSLRQRYPIFLVSDSLPFYTDYIRENLTDVFEGIFMSDQLGVRKSGGLFERTEAMSPGLFARSVYIDDRKANLAAAVSLGAVGLHFTGVHALVIDLQALGVGA